MEIKKGVGLILESEVGRRILEMMGSGPGIFHILMGHDDDCPAKKTHKTEDCRCDPEIVYLGKEN